METVVEGAGWKEGDGRGEPHKKRGVVEQLQ